jgi:hypothetical protein
VGRGSPLYTGYHSLHDLEWDLVIQFTAIQTGFLMKLIGNTISTGSRGSYYLSCQQPNIGHTTKCSFQIPPYVRCLWTFHIVCSEPHLSEMSSPKTCLTARLTATGKYWAQHQNLHLSIKARKKIIQWVRELFACTHTFTSVIYNCNAGRSIASAT